MNAQRYIFSSLTRISNLPEMSFEVVPLPREEWTTGDYVEGLINQPPAGYHHIELTNARMMPVMQGDRVIGAFGKRRATLEANGTWEKISPTNGRMDALTSAGLFGKLTSKSPFTQSLIPLKYQGHVIRNGQKVTMQQFAPQVPFQPFNTPVILVVGTSMSAGKTTVARIIVRQLKNKGYKVLGAKVAGAGRYRDIQVMADAGADVVLDFVDVGLPSTIHPTDEYRRCLRTLLSMAAQAQTDVAVVEIGSSPLEPYNGEVAIEAIRSNIKCTVLCASDPYAVYGVMKAFKMYPTLVAGPATNTQAGIDLIEKLCNVHALNAMDPRSTKALNKILEKALVKVFPKARPSHLVYSDSS